MHYSEPKISYIYKYWKFTLYNIGYMVIRKRETLKRSALLQTSNDHDLPPDMCQISFKW